MQKYGTIKDGKLVVSNTNGESYLPIEFGKIPTFNEESQYISYGDINEVAGVLLVNYKVLDIPLNENKENVEVENSRESSFEGLPMLSVEKTKEDLLKEVSTLKKENDILKAEDLNNKNAIFELYMTVMGAI